MKIADIRRSYVKDKLDLDQLNPDPFVQFETWLQAAIAAELPDPTAMCVATVDANGQPSQRLVLLKDVSPAGFVFYTNLGSRKANELSINPKVCLHFPWHPLERQVIVYGEAQRVPTSQVLQYFLSRPKRVSSLHGLQSKVGRFQLGRRYCRNLRKLSINLNMVKFLCLHFGADF